MCAGKNLLAFVVCCIVLPLTLTAQADCSFKWLDEKTLCVTDGVSEQVYLWDKGMLRLLRARSLSRTASDLFPAAPSDRSSDSDSPVATSWQISRSEATERRSAYTRIDLHAAFKEYELTRSLCIYDDCPGIEWRLSMKGKNSLFPVTSSADSDPVEHSERLQGDRPHYFFMPFSVPHFGVRVVSFREATDHHTNIVRSSSELPYRKPQYYRGSILLANRNGRSDEVHLAVKMAPLQEAQSAYAGFDFSTDFTGFKVHSPGFDFSDGCDTCRQEAYPLFSVMYAASEEEALDRYKKYELAVHKYLPHRDNTLTMNTWGDRNKDSRINESFILNELGAAAALGITHYQIDDGWQQGLSKNSAEKTNLLWDDWQASDWEVNSTRFPHGLKKVKEKADSLGISLGLWFNPSKNDRYAAWERDRNILLDLHRKHGISWIKIDGMEIGDRLSESRVHRMLSEAQEESANRLQFNMDVTAGKRGGFFYFHRFGNIFLENRYTDWGNYYPHLTLRNIWSLAKYVPVQRIQVEWLNKWRNANRYPPDDPLRPMEVPFDYLFAVTMMGQPLAWMEATGLPAEAFEVSRLIRLWQSERGRMQKGIIRSVGEEPDGYSFPGFVSTSGHRIYVLLFREHTLLPEGRYDVSPAAIGGKRFVKLAGEGEVIHVNTHTVKVNYPKPFGFIWGYFE